MGSIYDLPQTSRADIRTQAETSMGGSQYGYNPQKFEKTERAVRKKPFDTFYSTNITAENPNPQKVQFQQQNRFEGRSGYFNYYPTDSFVEQRLETVWFEH